MHGQQNVKIEILVAHCKKKSYNYYFWLFDYAVLLNDTLSEVHTLSCLRQIADCQAGRLHVCQSAKWFVTLVHHLTN
jgi:hypothetical protein